MDDSAMFGAIFKLYIMLVKLFDSDRFPHVEHCVHRIRLCSVNQIGTPSDNALDQARLSNFGITQNDDLEFKV